jgi:hypothetical protein
MQSENGILLLFYIFLSHENEKRGDVVSCPQAPVPCIWFIMNPVLKLNTHFTMSYKCEWETTT